MEAEKIADKIATGKRKLVTVNRNQLAEVGEIFGKKYNGSFTWFGLGNAICMRDDKEPLPVRANYKKSK